MLGVPLPGYEFLYIYEDEEGRERKREAPLGQVPSTGMTEMSDSATHSNSPSRKRPFYPSKKSEQARTRSQSKAIETLKKGTCTQIMTPQTYLHRPKKYRMCWDKVRDGISKISLPAGFWARMDTTARGRHVSLICMCVLSSISMPLIIIM